MGLLGDIDAYEFFFGKNRKYKKSNKKEERQPAPPLNYNSSGNKDDSSNKYLIFTMNLNYPMSNRGLTHDRTDRFIDRLEKDVQSFDRSVNNAMVWMEVTKKDDYKHVRVYASDPEIEDNFRKTYRFYIHLSAYFTHSNQDVLGWFILNDFEVIDFDGLIEEEILIHLNELNDYSKHFKGIKLGKEEEWLSLVLPRLNTCQWFKVYESKDTIKPFLPKPLIPEFDLSFRLPNTLVFRYFYISQQERFKINNEQFKKDLIESLNQYVYDDYFIPKLK